MSAPLSAWAGEAERGGRIASRFVVLLARSFGWHAVAALLPAISAWYVAFAPGPRRASRAFLGRVLGREPRLSDVLRHVHSFAAVILDRAFLLTGRHAGFRFEVRGLEHVAALAGSGRGALLFGAHLGSFEVMRTATARDCPVPVRALMHRGRGGETLTVLLERLNPKITEAIIEIGRPDTGIRVQEALARGELVGLLADRAPTEGRMVRVPFLGSEAAFPAGPFLLAAVTGAPVLLCFGLRTGRRRYTVIFEPFAARIALPRGTRERDLAAWVGRYAGRVETQARAHPMNWFNFYDFWRDDAPEGRLLDTGRESAGRGADAGARAAGHADVADGGPRGQALRPGVVP